MLFRWIILGASDDNFGQLAYVIALLVLGGLGALADKIKKKREESARHHPGEQEQRPEPSVGPPPDLERQRESRIPPVESRGQGPMTPVPQRRSPMSEAPPVPQRQPPFMEAPPGPPRRPVPMPARRPTKVQPARPTALGEDVASRKMGGEVGQLGREPALADDVQKAIAKMTSESVVTAVSASSPKAPTAALPTATLVGPVGKMSTTDLRRAFVMSEVFQPPLALRQ